MNKASLPSFAELSNFEAKIVSIKNKFDSCLSLEEKYHLIIRLGEALPPLNPESHLEENLVRGCQSKLYLDAVLRDGKMFFFAHSDALISAGLAALLIEIYSGETMERILTSPPNFLHTLGIHASLSPSRSNGLSQIYLKMKQLSISKMSNRL